MHTRLQAVDAKINSERVGGPYLIQLFLTPSDSIALDVPMCLRLNRTTIVSFAAVFTSSWCIAAESFVSILFILCLLHMCVYGIMVCDRRMGMSFEALLLQLLSGGSNNNNSSHNSAARFLHSVWCCILAITHEQHAKSTHRKDDLKTRQFHYFTLHDTHHPI